MHLLFYSKVFLKVYFSILFLILLYYQFSVWEMYTVKKSVDFTVKYQASAYGCQFFYRYFNVRLPVKHF